MDSVTRANGNAANVKQTVTQKVGDTHVISERNIFVAEGFGRSEAVSLFKDSE